MGGRPGFFLRRARPATPKAPARLPPWPFGLWRTGRLAAKQGAWERVKAGDVIARKAGGSNKTRRCCRSLNPSSAPSAFSAVKGLAVFRLTPRPERINLWPSWGGPLA